MSGAAPELSGTERDGTEQSGIVGAVVVGVSPKTGSPAALRWAAEEARLRGAALQAVMAWRPPRPPSAPGGRPPVGLPSLDEDPAVTAETALRDHVRTALGDRVETVSCSAVKGNAVDALLSAAAGAQLLVIGEPRASKLAKEKSARFTAPQVVLQAPCPVVVMPPA